MFLGVGGSSELAGWGACDICEVGGREIPGGKRCFLLGQQPSPGCCVAQQIDGKEGAGASWQGRPESRGFFNLHDQA